MRMIEAEAAVERARAELDLEDSQVLSEIGDLAPVMSARDKVRNLVNSSDINVLSVNLDHPSRGSMGCRGSPCRWSGGSDDRDRALVWHGAVGSHGPARGR